MKDWLLVLCVMCMFAANASAQNTDVIMLELQAQTAYAAGQYGEAAALYQQLIDEGVSSPDVYANLGAAYYQDQQLGVALVSLLRAQRYDPRDEEINAMIRRIRLERVDFQFGDVSYLDSVGTWMAGILTNTEFTWIVFVVWLVWNALLSVLFLWESLRKRLRGVFAIVTFVLVMSVGMLLIRTYVERERSPAVVVNDVVEIMSGPGNEYVTLYRLFEAAEMRVLEEREGWVRFALPDGRQGWVRADSILVV